MFEQIRANKIKSLVLVAGMTALLALVGYVGAEMLLGGRGAAGVIIALVLAIVWSVSTYFRGDSLILAMSSATPVTRGSNPQLTNVVEEMAIASGMPVPRVYLIDDTAPNAFATGRDPQHSAIAVTSGLVDKLNRSELQGVIAHELSHIQNRDILFMTMAGVLLGSIALLCDAFLRSTFWSNRLAGPRVGGRRAGRRAGPVVLLGLVFLIISPIVARLLYLAVSRRREYLADASSAAMTRYPEGLAAALEKIANDPEVLEVANRATAPLYIVNPIKRWEARASRFLSTHPPVEERVRILRMMAGGSWQDYFAAMRKATAP